MMPERIQAIMNYPQIDRETYHWIEFSAPTDFGSPWERECIDIANAFMKKLTAVPGFIDFFASHHYCIRKQEVQKFLKEQGSDLVFPTSREYLHPSTCLWTQNKEGFNHPGHIIDQYEWIYDRAALPKISVLIDGKEYFPFSGDKSCLTSCLDDNELAWDVCEASAYNVPELYQITKRFSDESAALYECGFNAESEPCVGAVLEYLDSILPSYEIIVDDDTMWVSAGEYIVRILDRTQLHDIIRKHKKEIKSIIKKFPR